MSFTIEKMLKMENLSDLKVLAGHNGLNRVIKYVTVMDAPDIEKWVGGGEMLLTTGYCLKDNLEDIENMIVLLNNKGVAAWAIKLNRFISKVPDNALRIADKLSFPIIQIPVEMKYLEIITPVLSDIINDQARKLEYSEKIHNSFTQLIIRGGGPQRIVNTLADILEADVAFYDASYDLKYLKSNSEKFSCDVGFMPLDDILKSYYSYQVYLDRKDNGYLIISDSKLKHGDTPEEYDKIAIEHASTVLKFEMQKNISNRKIEEGYRNAFIMDLIINNIKTPEEVKIRSNFYGWNFSSGTMAVIVDIDNFKKQYSKYSAKDKQYTMENIKEIIFETATRVMKSYFSQVPYTTLSDSIIYLISPPDDDKVVHYDKLKKIGEEIRDEISRMGSFTVMVGIGNYETSVMDASKSYENAKIAVKFGRVLHEQDAVVLFDELGVYRLLSLIYKSPEAKEYYQSYLKNLLDYDSEKDGELLDTLRCIVKHNWNLRAASAEMYVHYNTLKNRFNKISDLLGIDLGTPEQRTNIDISLKLMEMAE